MSWKSEEEPLTKGERQELNQTFSEIASKLNDIVVLFENLARIIDYTESEDEESGKYPCDYPDDDGYCSCPYDANGSDGCRHYCGIGVDE